MCDRGTYTGGNNPSKNHTRTTQAALCPCALCCSMLPGLLPISCTQVFFNLGTSPMEISPASHPTPVDLQRQRNHLLYKLSSFRYCVIPIQSGPRHRIKSSICFTLFPTHLFTNLSRIQREGPFFETSGHCEEISECLFKH